MSTGLKGKLGNLPNGFLEYFESKFPGLFTHIYTAIERCPVREELAFKTFFFEKK